MSVNTNSNNYYESDPNKDYNTLEKVILAEAVSFSSASSPIKGKFFYSVMTPENDSTDPQKSTDAMGNQTTNYVELMIPASLLVMFMSPYVKRLKDGDGAEHNYMLCPSTGFTIPKDTVLVAELIGGKLELEKLTIVGVCVEEE